MKIRSINKRNRESITKFMTKHGMGGIVNDCNFTLMDEAPDHSYYSYFVEVEGREFGIIINYEENIILIHKNYQTKLQDYISE